MAKSILSTTEEANEIHDMSFLSIMKFDSDIRNDLYADDVLHHLVPSDRRAHDQGVHCVGTIYDEIKVVAPPARRYRHLHDRTARCRAEQGLQVLSLDPIFFDM